MWGETGKLLRLLGGPIAPKLPWLPEDEEGEEVEEEVTVTVDDEDNIWVGVASC